MYRMPTLFKYSETSFKERMLYNIRINIKIFLVKNWCNIICILYYITLTKNKTPKQK